MSEQHLIAAGVRNLQEFGYGAVTADNIMTDSVYRRFFKAMLEGNLGDPRFNDGQLRALIARIDDSPSEDSHGK